MVDFSSSVRYNLNHMKPLIILGNGKSLADVDFDMLDTHATFGLNSAYKRFKEIGWYPKYYGIFNLFGSLIDFPDAVKFIQREHQHFKQIFYYGEELMDLLTKTGLKIDNLQHVNLTKSENYNLNIPANKFAYPMPMDIQMAKELLQPEDRIAFDLFIEFLNKREIEEIKSLNKTGIVKYFLKERILESDHITKPRYSLNWTLPESYELFNFLGGNSSMIATLIGYLMGYKKVILLGCDSRWKADGDNFNIKDGWWFENYFHKEYNLKEDCSICTPETMQDMHIDGWETAKGALEAHDTDFEIVNCTPNSALEMFRKSTLEEELWK